MNNRYKRMQWGLVYGIRITSLLNFLIAFKQKAYTSLYSPDDAIIERIYQVIIIVFSVKRNQVSQLLCFPVRHIFFTVLLLFLLLN
jgi:hypothetical protein